MASVAVHPMQNVAKVAKGWSGVIGASDDEVAAATAAAGLAGAARAAAGNMRAGSGDGEAGHVSDSDGSPNDDDDFAMALAAAVPPGPLDDAAAFVDGRFGGSDGWAAVAGAIGAAAPNAPAAFRARNAAGDADDVRYTGSESSDGSVDDAEEDAGIGANDVNDNAAAAGDGCDSDDDSEAPAEWDDPRPPVLRWADANGVSLRADGSSGDNDNDNDNSTAEGNDDLTIDRKGSFTVTDTSGPAFRSGPGSFPDSSAPHASAVPETANNHYNSYNGDDCESDDLSSDPLGSHPYLDMNAQRQQVAWDRQQAAQEYCGRMNQQQRLRPDEQRLSLALLLNEAHRRHRVALVAAAGGLAALPPAAIDECDSVWRGVATGAMRDFASEGHATAQRNLSCMCIFSVHKQPRQPHTSGFASAPGGACGRLLRLAFTGYGDNDSERARRCRSQQQVLMELEMQAATGGCRFFLDTQTAAFAPHDAPPARSRFF